MSAASIASLTLGSASSIPTLTLTAAGFNVAGTTTLADSSAEVLNVNNGGVMTNSTLAMSSRNALVTVNSGGAMTNGATQIDNNGSNDGTGKLTVNSGAIASLGAVSIGRHNQSLTIGLQIAGGTVLASSIDVGTRNSYATMVVSGGTVTNAGNLRLGTQATGDTAGRPVLYNQTGGTVGVAGLVEMGVGSTYTTWFDVQGSSSLFSAAGVQIFPNATTAGVARFTNSSSIYLGASGFNVLNPSAGTYTVILNNGGLFGALADWSGNVNATLPSGIFTFSPVDLGGTGHTITLTGVLSGAGGLLVTNAGTLALANTNTYTGNTTVGTGSTLQLGDGVNYNGTVAGLITNNGTLTVANPNSQSIVATNIIGGALVKNGAGTLSLVGTNTTISGVTINAGTLQLGDGVTFNGAVPGNITDNANGTLAVANPTAQTLANVITGAGSFAKSGAGVLTIGANENYSGSTTVNAGSVIVGAGGSIGSTQNVTIASGGLLDVSASASGGYTVGSGYVFTAGRTSGSGTDFHGNLTNNGTINIPAAGTFTLNGNLSMLNGGTSTFNLGLNPGAGSTIALTGGGALHLSGTTTVQVNFSVLGVGTYPLISGASSVSGGLGNLNLVLNGSIGSYGASLQVTATGVNLVVTGNPHNLVWLGDGSANSWDNNTANLDWMNSVAHTNDYFASGYYVTFDDTGAANQPVLNAVVSPATTTINGTSSYTLSGGGYINSGSLTNNSTGTLFVQTPNTYSGGTVINAGTVEVDNGGAIGTGPVVDNSALTFNNANGNNADVISGNGTVTVENGAETLSAANTYAGGTTISSGTLQLGAANAVPGGTVAGDVTNNGTLDLSTFNDTINGLTGSGTVDTLAGGSPTLTVGGNGDSATFGGIIQNSSGTLNLTKKGGGTEILGSANTYGGGTAIASGTLALGVANALPIGTTVTLGGSGTAGTLDLGGFSQQVAGLAIGSGAVAANQVIGNSSASPSTLTFTNGGTSTFGGTIQDVLGAGTSTVALAVNGGSLVLNGTNTYSGGTTINSGGNSKLTVSGGLLEGTTLTMNTVNGSLGFLLSGGTASFSGNVLFSADNGNNANFIDITGGVLDVGSLTSGRCSPVLSGAAPTAGQTTSDIYITGNPTVNITNALGVGGFNVGANSSTSMRMDGGTVNVGGTTTITLNNGGRWSVLDINGGTFTSTDATGAGIQIGGGYVADSAELLIRAGTISADTITLGDAATQTAGTNLLNQTGGTLYLGSGGIVAANAAPTYTNTVKLGTATVGAQANWSSSLPMALSGTTTFQAADVNSNSFNITLNGVLSGSAVLNKTGGGILTLGGADTYTGNTMVNAGTLAVGAGGSISSFNIVVGTNGTFDVSQVTGGFTLNGSQSLKGFGTVVGMVTAASGSSIYAGSNSVTGTLTLAGGLTESGGANNFFTLSTNVSGPNGSINVPGTLAVSGVNTIFINGSVQSGGVYPVISYAGGSFSGSTANFTVSGASGALSNSPTAKTIYFVAQGSVRSPTSVTWLGNALADNWDTEVTTNWLNTGTGLHDIFVPGDNALFSDLGATNPSVNLVGTVTPNSITVNTASNYTFTGTGSIGGAASLTVSNGTLTVLTTNTYTGPTILDGGVLSTPLLAVSGAPSGIGAATSDPGNLVLNGATLNYSGATAGTDHGITLTNTGGTIGVTGGTALTLNGSLTGNGALTKVGNGTLILPNANSYAGNTTIGGGVLQINNAAAVSSGTISFSNAALAFNPGGAITVANNFSFAAGTTNMIIVTAGGATSISSGTWTGSGLLIVSNTYNPFTVNGVLDGFTGTILLATPNGSGFRFNSGGGNTSFGSLNATFDLGQGSAILTCRNAGTMNLGALQGGSGTSVVGQGADSGTVTWSIGNNNLSTIFAGAVKDSTSARLSALAKVGTGALTLNGASTYSGATVINSGTLLVNGSIIGQYSAGAVTVSGGTLGGAGIIGGAVTVQAGGTLAPGAGTNAAGTVLTINNSLTLQTGSTNIMQLSIDSYTNDNVVAGGTITYAGTLVVTTNGLDLTALTNGAVFTLFNSTTASYAGSFDNTNLPPLGAGLAWTNTLAIDGSIEVISNGIVTPPAPAAGFSGTPTSGVAPLPVTFTDSSTGTITNWIWNLGDGTSVTNSSNANVNHTYAAGTYTVSLTVSGPGGSSTNTLLNYITVSAAPPVAGFSGTPTNIFVTQTVTFTDASSGSITNWIWNFGDGHSVTNISNANVNHAYAVVGTNTVSLVVNGPGGSSTNTRANYIAVKSRPVLGRPVLSGNSLILSGVNGPAGQQYRILSTTNVALPLASWTPVYTNTFNADGSYGYTNTPLTGKAGFLLLVSP
jgi:autotransporter-associated beta strand protein